MLVKQIGGESKKKPSNKQESYCSGFSFEATEGNPLMKQLEKAT